MTSGSLWATLENSSLGSTIAGNEWMFPTIETIHVIAIVTVIGAIAVMDLRLLGLTSGTKSVAAMERDTLPVTWVAFAVAVISGLLLFVSKAQSYMANPYFLWKTALMALAGVNMAVFHRYFSKDVASWGVPGGAIPINAKLSATLSLALWMAIPFCGRVIGFTLGTYYAG
uniref:hypothetical protein n=1 Tax=Altererythrobacter segetis TaxID=1104773 RepID=UPI0014074F78|nr:hypothetical protein [Altererythrobacter segetis]